MNVRRADLPLVFCDYQAKCRIIVQNITARNLFQLHGNNHHMALTKKEENISNVFQYRWYD